MSGFTESSDTPLALRAARPIVVTALGASTPCTVLTITRDGSMLRKIF
jgi:hypothetical protein